MIAPWIDTDPLTDALARDEAAREAEEQQAAIRKHLEALGWTSDAAGAMHHDIWRISFDRGWWTLAKWDDESRWLDVVDGGGGLVEGRTLASLRRALALLPGPWPHDWDAEPRYGADDAADQWLATIRDEGSVY